MSNFPEAAGMIGAIAGILFSLGIIWTRGIRPLFKLAKRIEVMHEIVTTFPEWQDKVDDGLQELALSHQSMKSQKEDDHQNLKDLIDENHETLKGRIERDHQNLKNQIEENKLLLQEHLTPEDRDRR